MVKQISDNEIYMLIKYCDWFVSLVHRLLWTSYSLPAFPIRAM